MELFRFEDDFVATLRCIPMAVRFKLDACGVKVTLRQWSAFGAEDRSALLAAPCDSGEEIAAFRTALVHLIAVRAGAQPTLLPPVPAAAWENGFAIPDEVSRFADLKGVAPPSDLEWRALSPLRRFVLVKLTRDSHDNENFVPALKEFGLFHPPPARASSP